MGQTTAATADKYGRGSGTQNPQLSGKEKHVKKSHLSFLLKDTPSLNGGNACRKDTSGSKLTPPADKLQSIYSALLEQTERATNSDGEMRESDGKCVEKKFDSGSISKEVRVKSE